MPQPLGERLITKEGKMPIIKVQTAKAISTVNSQPHRMTSRIQLIVMMDISGSNGNQIAAELGLTAQRVSIIRNSPMFLTERERQMYKLKNQVVDKKSSAIAEGDPVELKIKALAGRAVETYSTLLGSASDVVRKTTADSILDRSGYKAYTEKTKVSVEVTEKMATRFEEVLSYDESGTNAREAKITITKEVS